MKGRKGGRKERRKKGRKKRIKCLKKEKTQKEKERRCRMNGGIRAQWLASPDKALLLFPASHLTPSSPRFTSMGMCWADDSVTPEPCVLVHIHTGSQLPCQKFSSHCPDLLDILQDGRRASIPASGQGIPAGPKGIQQAVSTDLVSLYLKAIHSTHLEVWRPGLSAQPVIVLPHALELLTSSLLCRLKGFNQTTLWVVPQL